MLLTGLGVHSLRSPPPRFCKNGEIPERKELNPAKDSGTFAGRGSGGQIPF